jgi:hypothetical protein
MNWEQWRKQLSQDSRGLVSPAYTNKTGAWHPNFRVGEAEAGEDGELHYPSNEPGISVAGGLGGFNKADLIRRVEWGFGVIARNACTIAAGSSWLKKPARIGFVEYL